jgi:hypothetical protein
MFSTWNDRMYSMICEHRASVIARIIPQQVGDYEWLLEHVSEAETQEYQRAYRKFWGMRGVSTDFYRAYFKILRDSIAESATPADVCRELSPNSLRGDGQQTIQFSFATKLCHVLRPHCPIYDSHVSRFYLYREPSAQLSLETRIEGLVEFYRSLIEEQKRVLSAGFLALAISVFREKFLPQRHTDEKIVDWLIWAFMGYLEGGKPHVKPSLLTGGAN